MTSSIFEETVKQKYVLIEVHKLPQLEKPIDNIDDLIVAMQQNTRIVNFNTRGFDDEYFVLKLKDIYARPALKAYAKAIKNTNERLYKLVKGLIDRSGIRNKDCKQPD